MNDCIVSPRKIRWTQRVRYITSPEGGFVEVTSNEADSAWIVGKFIDGMRISAEIAVAFCEAGFESDECVRWLERDQYLVNGLGMRWDWVLAAVLAPSVDFEATEPDADQAIAAEARLEIQGKMFGPALLRAIIAGAQPGVLPSQITLDACYLIPWGSEVYIPSSYSGRVILSERREVFFNPVPVTRVRTQTGAQDLEQQIRPQTAIDRLLRR